MPCECTDIGRDIRKFADLTEDEVEEIVEEMSSENMRKLMQIRQDIFDDAHGNIKRAQKRQNKVEEIVEEMSSKNMRKLMQIRQDI